MNKIEPGTIVRTICLALALINQVLTASGRPIINVSDETITQLITAGVTIVTALVAWWKNNSFTKNAIKADRYLSELREK